MGQFVYRVIGGDKRLAALSILLASAGEQVHRIQSESDIGQADWRNKNAIILPFTKDILGKDGQMVITHQQLSACLSAGDHVFGGELDQENHLLYSQRRIHYHNMLSNESFCLKNALVTAEAALSLLLIRMDSMIHGTPILVFGYGRIGKALSGMLHALKAKVAAASLVDAEITQAHIDGMDAYALEDAHYLLSSYSVVINTIPVQVLYHSDIKALPKNSLIIDLASNPGGLDHVQARRLGHRCVHALGLPGKKAPVSCAQFMCEYIHNTLQGDHSS